ncbi:hypothetical protein HI914_06552, partial [Erysiphe necator]
ANLPNLRRLFVEARSEAEESAYSRKAVSSIFIPKRKKFPSVLFFFLCTDTFYNLVLYMSSVAFFSLIAQRVHKVK